MPPRPSYFSPEDSRLLGVTRFQQQTEADLFSLAFRLNSEASLAHLQSLVEEPAPQPRMAPPRIEAPAAPMPEAPRFQSAEPAAPLEPIRFSSAEDDPNVSVEERYGMPRPMEPVDVGGPAPAAMPQITAGAAPPIAGSNPDAQAAVYRQGRASGLDDEGAKILVAISETEGGTRGAVGDQGKATGVYQFHEGGEMPGFRSWLAANNIQGDPNQLAVDPSISTRYAAEGYLGRAIAAGRQKGLSGSALATYVQQYGQRSVDPGRTGQNYERLFGQGAPPQQITGDQAGQPGMSTVTPIAPSGRVVPNAQPNSYWTSGGTHGGAPAADIFAPEGSPIYAPVGGVSMPAVYPSGGNATTIKGDDGRYYYMAHGAVPFKGGRVEAGQPIGQVGRTGNAQGTSPHLHYAIASNPSIFGQRNGSGDIEGEAYWQAPTAPPAPPNAGAAPPQAATAAPAPPATGSGTSSPPATAAGGSGDDMVTIQSNTGGTLTVKRSMVGEGPGQYSAAPKRGGYQIVGQPGDMQRVSLTQQPQPMPEDASDSERHVRGLSEPTAPLGPPLRRDVPFDPATNTTGPLPTDAAETMSYRQPLGPTMGPDTGQGEYVDPDAGPRESGYTLPPTVTYNDPTMGGTQQQPVVASPSTYGASGDTPPSNEFLPMPAWAAPEPEPAPAPAAPPPGRIQWPNERQLAPPVGRDTGVTYGPAPVPEPPSRWSPQVQADLQGTPANPTPTAPAMPAPSGPVEQAISSAGRSSFLNEDAGRQAVDIYNAIQELPFEAYARARQQLISDAEAGRLSGTDPVAPLRALGIPLPSVEVLNPQGRPASDVLGGLILAGALPDPSDPVVQTALAAAGKTLGLTARGVRAGVRAAAPVVEQGASVVRRAANAIPEGLAANAERVAAADARMLEQGSTAAPGTLGVVMGTDAQGVARRRVIPPEVADTLDFPVRIPDDPSFARAVEAAGGRIDAERGVDLGLTRAQSPTAAGRPATRGGVFYEAIPEGGRSSFVTSTDNPNAVGGTEALPRTPSRFRSPLVIQDAPGSGGGFDEGMRLVQDRGDPQAVVAARQQEETLYQRMLELDRQYSEAVSAGRDPTSIENEYTRIADAHDVARERHLSLLDKSRPLTSQEIDDEIRQARSAGPEGSPERAQALKDLVARYGGDPDLIDDLLAIRGADASESAWAIKENILSHNARRAGYDGVLTVQNVGPDEAAVMAHPKVVAAQQAVEEAATAYERAIDAVQAREATLMGEYGRRPGDSFTTYLDRLDSFVDTPGYKSAAAATERDPDLRALREQLPRLEQASNDAEQAYIQANNAARQELGSGRITELMDVREGANPTPGAPHPLIEQMKAEKAAAQQEWDALSAQVYAPGHQITPEETQQLVEIARRIERAESGLANQNRLPTTTPPGYTLRPDIKRRGGETDASSTLGISAPSGSTLGTRVAADAGSSLGSGTMGAAVGAGLPADSDEERRRNALTGAVIGMVGGPLASRAMRGRGARGALATPGVSPGGNTNRAAQSPNPHIRNLARQMQGNYNPTGVPERPLAERVVAALTDKNAIVGNVEREVKERVTAAGNVPPLTRLAERVRANPNSIAAQRAREELAPALQKVGDDADWAEQYMVHQHNLDVAKAKGQEAYDEAIVRGRTPQQAQAIADRVRTSRLFSGGMTEQDITQALADIPAEIGPTRFQNVVDAARAHWDTWRKSLDEKLAEGMIPPAVHQELTTRYPHYVRTDIADYFERGPAMPSPGGKTMGVSNIGIKAIDRVGTTKDRVNPVLSTIDGLYAHEASVVRNAAARDLVTLRDADPTTRQLFKEVAPDVKTYRANQTDMVPPDYSLRGNEQKLTEWNNGEARQFVIPGEYAQLLTPRQGALLGDSALAQGTRNFFGLWKALITTHNPGFQMVVSPIRDLGDYTVGEATRSASASGPRGVAQAIRSVPGVLADYARALPAAFEGLGSGQFSQEVADLRRAGAGFEGRPARTDRALRSAYRDLQQSGGMAITSPEDAARAARTILTLGAEPIGSRLELVPRIAAARRAAGRGADELGQAMAFKDATIDFLRGGWLTQQLNVPVPFLNPTVQSAAQVGRLVKKNPTAFAAAVTAGIGVPAMLADAWNRSDEQRARDYEDVPDSVKNGGITIMLPGVEGSTEIGDRKPNYLWIPLGSFAFAARLAREGLGLADPATGLTPTQPKPGREVNSPADAAMRAAELGSEILGMFSPVKGENLSSAVASLVPPVASEAIEIGIDKDLYRGNQIATDRRDENASNLSQGAAAALNYVGNTDQIRPSQVEHVVRGVGGYAGQLATAASDLGRNRGETRPIQDIPVLGGLVNRVVRDTGGQQLEDARDPAVRVPEGIRSVLAEAGLRSDEVTAVPSTLQQIPLTRAEQTDWQQRTNAYIENAVDRATRSPEYRRRGADQGKIIKDAISIARERAGAEVLRTIPQAERNQRIRSAQDRKAS